MQAAYVDSLLRLEKTARAAERSRDVNSLNTSLLIVIEAANRLGFLGYQINWEQNIRWALRATRYGLSDYAIVDGCDPALDNIDLTERLAVLGTLTFWKQQRGNGKLKDPAEVAFSKSAEEMYGAVKLVRGELVGSRYASHWFGNDKTGMCYRILSDLRTRCGVSDMTATRCCPNLTRRGCRRPSTGSRRHSGVSPDTLDTKGGHTRYRPFASNNRGTSARSRIICPISSNGNASLTPLSDKRRSKSPRLNP